MNKKNYQRIWIFVIREKSVQKIWVELLDTAEKTGHDTAKTASKKLHHKTAETTEELIGNKIAEKLSNQNMSVPNSRNVEEIVIPPEKRQRILKN